MSYKDKFPDMDNPAFEKGLKVRREVLGSAYVDASLTNMDAFMQPFQKLATEWCWGEIWTRPGLPKKTRSMLNLMVLTALNRPNELKLHLRGAVNNGVTPLEIQEILLQATIYAGVPAGLDAFKVAQATLKEIDAERAQQTGAEEAKS
ncbi:MAG: carboxymuconolactone decarboxylase family protein [Bosea sp. (in: a-proteobacteria)]